MSTVIELDRNPRTVKETRPERGESRNNQDMDEVERPPGPGPGIRETENQSQTESQDDLVLPYSLGHHPTYVFNPALTARMPPNSFIGITPPPMPMMDYQSVCQSVSQPQQFTVQDQVEKVRQVVSCADVLEDRWWQLICPLTIW